MDLNLYLAIVVLPGAVAVGLLTLFSYLQIQTREHFFRTWQVAWMCYLLSFTLVILRIKTAPHSMLLGVLSKTFFVWTAVAIFVSVRLIRDEYKARWSDLALGLGGLGFAVADTYFGQHPEILAKLGWLGNWIDTSTLVLMLLVISALQFFRRGLALSSLAFKLLGAALAAWSALISLNLISELLGNYAAAVAHTMGPVPHMLIGVAMVMVLFESERRTVEENLLAFSILNPAQRGSGGLLDLKSELQRMLERLLQVMRCDRGAILLKGDVAHPFLVIQTGFTNELFAGFIQQGTCERVIESAFQRGRPLATSFDPRDIGPRGVFPQEEAIRPVMMSFGVRGMACSALPSGAHADGAVLVAHGRSGGFGAAQLRTMDALVRQIALTLQNHKLVQETQRRREESELLTEIGQVLSSRLDPDDILATVQRELGRLFDTRFFYVAMLEGDTIRFEYECEDGQVVPKRSRTRTNGLSEHIIATGQPLLVRSEMEERKKQLNLIATGRPSKCFCGVPLFGKGAPIGAMAVLNYEQENVYNERDLEVMRTAAGQVSIALENARLFHEEQRRATTLSFLNSVSRTAISSQNADQMLTEIAREIQKNFAFDHIGLGILDYGTKEIELKAEAGNITGLMRKRIPLGVGILGRVARANEPALVQGSDQRLLSLIPNARSVLCVPLSYSESLLGVLNVESLRDNAFSQEDALLLRTLADLLAAALHNALVFEKMQQQSITDGLTGIKTRRFFLEAVQSEWRRASRSGRQFSVVLIDLDKFKEVNDSMGHLEGDLVLSRIGRLLEQKSRQSNIIARYGGDEFVILMPETGMEQAQILSERLRLWIATDAMLAERKITGSFGVATFPLHGATVEDIIRIADAGMYVSKRAGGNKVSTPDEFGASHSLVTQRQLVTTYVEGFLQREHPGPESIDELVETMQNLRRAIQDDPREPMRDALLMLTRAAETREVHSAGHSEAVGKHVEAIALEMGLPAEQSADFAFAARIHDVGKVLIPEKILNKPHVLTEEEFHLVKLHPALGEELVRVMPGGTRMAAIVRHHHERFDGSGYPDRLTGDQIPMGARMIAVVEAYVNMTMERPYAEMKTPNEAFEELESLSGMQFDGMIVRVFARMLRGARSMRSGQ